MTVFCGISVRKAKIAQEFFRSPFHSCTIFEAYLRNSLRFSKVKFFHFTPQVKSFFNRERNIKPKIFGTKNGVQRKILTFVNL